MMLSEGNNSFNVETPALKTLYENVIANIEDDLLDNSKKCDEILNSLDKCSVIVDSLRMFENFDTLDDIPTRDIQYLILPYYNALVLMRKSDFIYNNDEIELFHRTRLELLNLTQTKLRSFLTLLNCFKEFSSSIDNRLLEDADVLHSRTKKIQIYKTRRENERELSERASLLLTTLDEEVLRSYMQTKIKNSIFHSLEILQGIPYEISLLKHALEKSEKRSNSSTVTTTRKTVSDNVFKCVWNLPTMDIQTHLINLNNLKDKFTLNSDTRDMDIYEQRRLDDYKDTHPSGWGNRYNRG